ncbi:MAG: putative baseplate assembly protein [Methylocystis sp.]|nr:putative baseplate assembly protein [Methylocystis sp.]
MNAYACCDEKRRAAVLASALNGVDYLEVVDADAPTPADRQRILRVHFLKPPPPGLTPSNIVISGGDRITLINADEVHYDAGVVIVHLDVYGDYSIYRLQFVGAKGSTFDPGSLDSQLSFVDFSFKAECPSDFDCASQPAPACPPPLAPHIDYLAKDYLSFRQAMLDRLATLAPQWSERNAADLGVALVELFPHVGDLLSYRQDAVATEAYLGTARRRVSVRRHARLVDYYVHEGVNARAFLHVGVGADVTLKQGVQAFTALPGQAARLAPGSDALAIALSMGPQIFETMQDVSLFSAHNAMAFYTFGDGRCRLQKGATSAVLKGKFDKLNSGDILVFEEVIGPRTGKPEDADPARRWAVRLAKVTLDQDPIGGSFETPPIAGPTPITRIEWPNEDATPFAFHLSTEVISGGVARQVQNVTVARGNIVLADHGASVIDEKLGQVPAPTLFRPPVNSDPCALTDPTPIPPRYRPRLRGRPLVYAVPYDPKTAPASATAILRTSPDQALPRIIRLTALRQGQQPTTWTAKRDLLASKAEATHFVVETESDGFAYLRFGDDAHGQRPAPGVSFEARYRVGDATRGNVAADSISHIVSADPAIRSVRNPLKARGGTVPESLEHARRNAPIAFRVQRRAVTAEDYEIAAQTHPQVQRAAAAFRWTGSWPTVLVTIDRLGGAAVDDAFAEELRLFLEPYRLAGHDLQVNGPNYAPLEIVMRVTAQQDHFRADVKEALLRIFSTGFTPDGARGVFHPDNFTFGQPVYLSPLYAAAQAVDGVAVAQVTTFQRKGRPDPQALAEGKLEMGRLEIARLDNDPDFPERGVFRVLMEGGK